MRFVKLLVGLALLPACVAVTLTLVRVVEALRPEAASAPHGYAFGIGFSLWCFLFFSLPRPVRAYVIGHELTHALWGLLMGARIGRMRVSRRGGSVQLSRSNFLITLAPYFFPFYTMIVFAAYGVVSIWFDQGRWLALWMALAGLTWGFHVTFTLATLATQQQDIQEHGRLFSYAVIYLFSVAGTACWLALFARPTLAEVGRRLAGDLRRCYAGALPVRKPPAPEPRGAAD